MCNFFGVQFSSALIQFSSHSVLGLPGLSGGGGALQAVCGCAFGDPVGVHQGGHLDVVEVLVLHLLY